MKFLAIFAFVIAAFFAFAQADKCADIFCPYNYQPVCAQPKAGGKAQTFGNDCAVGAYACTANTEYVVISQGECP